MGNFIFSCINHDKGTSIYNFLTLHPQDNTKSVNAAWKTRSQKYGFFFRTMQEYRDFDYFCRDF